MTKASAHPAKVGAILVDLHHYSSFHFLSRIY